MPPTPTTTTITESTMGNNNKNSSAVEMVLPERLTVRRLIELYIDHQIDRYTAQYRQESLSGAPNSFFLAAPEECELNEPKTGKGYKAMTRKYDRPKLYERALTSFQTNGFVLLVDEKQMESLDDEVLIRPKTEVRFLKLMPLVGG